MKQLKVWGAVTLILMLGIIGWTTFGADAATTTYASDSFNRTLSRTWGKADVGGAYTLGGTLANFSVSTAGGKIVSPQPNSLRSASLYAVSAQDIEFSFRFKTNKNSVGGDQMAYFVARRDSSNNDYVARIRLHTGGTVWLTFFKEIGGSQTFLGNEVQVPGLTRSAAQIIRVRGQVIGANPVTLNLRAWLDGKQEPSLWHYSTLDYSALLQTAGTIGLRTYLDISATNAPVSFTFDDLLVTDASVPTPTATPNGTATINPTATPTRTATPMPTPSSPRTYWGALVQGLAPDTNNMGPGGPFDTFEQDAGKKMAIIHWGQPWSMNGQLQQFVPVWFDNVRNHGSIPMINWASWDRNGGPDQQNFQNAYVTAGHYDAFIRQWATDAKNWGHPFFLRFDHEMNGWWYPWGEGNTGSGIVNGNQPGDYVKMWRHVHDIFTNVGATNVTWVWCPNIMSMSTNYPPIAQVYPGDGYVDWTCLDGYNKDASYWAPFNMIFSNVGAENWMRKSYAEVINLAPTKPLLVGETASRENNDGGVAKAAWITDAYLTQLPIYFPKIRGILWLNWDEGNPGETFPIETTALAQAAFSGAIGTGYFPANIFGNISTSPIQPLK